MATHEEIVFPAYCNTSHLLFSRIIINVEAAIFSIYRFKACQLFKLYLIALASPPAWDTATRVWSSHFLNSSCHHIQTSGQAFQYIWHDNGEVKAQVDTSGGNDTVTYLHSDHLLTTRVATAQGQQVIWRWQGEAFGNSGPDEIGGVVINLRFPGQYFDEETNLHYNHFRYYNAELGRYITSDPVGLASGPNTFVYVDSSPLRFIDSDGLNKFDKLFGLPRKFWQWYHRNEKRPGDPDIGKDEALELFEEWKKKDKPGPDQKRNLRDQNGFIDPSLLEFLVPLYLTPLLGTPLGCGELDCDGDGFPDDELKSCPCRLLYDNI